MALNTLLVLLSGLHFVSAGQDARLDTQLVTPVSPSLRVTSPQAAAQDPPLAALTAKAADHATPQTAGDRVSVQFRDARLAEIVAWLEQHGVNFALSSGEIPAGTTISLNINNESMRTVLAAIARALGGRWELESGVRVFRHGSGGVAYLDVDSRPTAKNFFAVPLNKDNPLGPDFKKSMEDFARSMADQSRQIEKQFGPDFQRKMEGQTQELQKQFGPDFQKKLETQAKDWSKLYEFDSRKQLKDMLGPDFKEQLRKILEEATKNGRILQADPRTQAQIQQEVDKAMHELQRALAEVMGAQADSGRAASPYKFELKTLPGRSIFMGGDKKPGVGLDDAKVKKLLGSLTSDQRDTQSKQGFVWWDDLTRDQQDLLGPRPKGHFEIHYKLGDDEIAVHGN